MNTSKYYGQKNIMTCGMEATVIGSYYEGKRYCLLVRFEDGTVVDKVTPIAFKKGYVRNPSLENYTPAQRTYDRQREKYVGQKIMMDCGMEAEVIDYQNRRNIKVRFSDGTVVSDVTTTQLKYHCVVNPNVIVENKRYAQSRNKYLGITKTMNCGMDATIIEYIGFHNISVRFDDGTIVKKKAVDAFLNGKIQNPNMAKSYPRGQRYRTNSLLAEKYIGKTKKMNCGAIGRITSYSDCKHICVEFDNGVKMQTSTVRFNHGDLNPYMPRYRSQIQSPKQ